MCERDRGREKVLSELSVLARKPGLVRACPFVLHTAVSTLDRQKHSCAHIPPVSAAVLTYFHPGPLCRPYASL